MSSNLLTSQPRHRCLSCTRYELQGQRLYGPLSKTFKQVLINSFIPPFNKSITSHGAFKVFIDIRALLLYNDISFFVFIFLFFPSWFLCFFSLLLHGHHRCCRTQWFSYCRLVCWLFDDVALFLSLSLSLSLLKVNKLINYRIKINCI